DEDDEGADRPGESHRVILCGGPRKGRPGRKNRLRRGPRVASGAHAALVRAEPLVLLVEVAADVDHAAHDEIRSVAGLARLTRAVDLVQRDLLDHGVRLHPRRAGKVVLGGATRESHQAQQRDRASHDPSSTGLWYPIGPLRPYSGAWALLEG